MRRGFVVAAILGSLLCAVFAGVAVARTTGFPPALAEFEGLFGGQGGKSSFIAIEHGGEGWIRGLDGMVPSTCVMTGRAWSGRDGEGAIHFSLSSRHKLLGVNQASPDGRFAFGIKHAPTDRYDTAYTVWIKARFERSVIRGRVHGSGVDSFWGKCHGDRRFVARRTR